MKYKHSIASLLLVLLICLQIVDAKRSTRRPVVDTWNIQSCVNQTANGLTFIPRYEQWRNIRYQGDLAFDPNFWRYQTQGSIFPLTNGIAMNLATSRCKESFQSLKSFRGGRQGPVDPQNAYKAMCSVECHESDALHLEALYYSGCKCLDINPTGDWCKENSGYLLCERIGFCGIWKCNINDFMCPRYEYNRREVEYKGPGDCFRNSGPRGVPFITLGATTVAASFISMAWFW
jgi:hypothetical protein